MEELRELSLLLVLLTMIRSTVSGVFRQEQVFTISPHSVRVNAGEDVFLECVIQNQQGKAQWTKDGFALGFERDVPGYPRHSYSGDPSKGQHHLVIKGATLDDDGEYQCQVGPTTDTSALAASANVTVMVAPTSLNIIRGADSSVVQGTEGHNLYLQCLVNGARPAPSIAWYRNGLMLDDSKWRSD
ncbi:kin of IRRE-like protein 2 [Macrobrachium nipponense]|uniref:kin of IRRE-like protein 2 n=1 Tax=Macrobrachium nipponense TaxID=159736 RepID=UPI0030C8584F